jgi:putative SOS response-associated peptidase YedK
LSCALIVTHPTTLMLPYHDRMPVLLQQAEVDRWLPGKMHASELHPASESALREWPIDQRINKADIGMTIQRCWSRSSRGCFED